jgi:hypothetical protein
MPSDTAETIAFGPYSCHPSQHFSAKLRTVRIEDIIAARCSVYVCTCGGQMGQALRPKRKSRCVRAWTTLPEKTQN